MREGRFRIDFSILAIIALKPVKHPLKPLTHLCCSALFFVTVAHGDFTGSVQTSVGYESNLYLVDHNNLAGVSTMVLGVQPELSWRSGPQFSVTYNAAAQRFTSASSEDHIRHNLTLSGRGEVGSLKWQGRTQMTRVQGSGDSIVFVGGRNAWATANTRERRNQWQNRSSLDLQQDLGEGWFVRGVGQLAWFDLDINPDTTPGYDHYINRYDLHGTVYVGQSDIGGWAMALGFRRGYIHQGRQGGRLSDRSNHYNAVLLNIKGRLSETLTLTGEAGPSFHSFNEGPGELSRTTVFSQMTLDWKPAAEHSLRLAVNNRYWVASVGVLSSTVFGATANWQWQQAAIGTLNLSGQWEILDYDGVNTKDTRYTVRLGWSRKLSEDWRISASLSRVILKDDAQGRVSRESYNTVAQTALSYGF